MTIQEFCKVINLQDEITGKVLTYYNSPDFEVVCKQLDEVRSSVSNAQNAIQQMYGILAPDERQVKMLAYMLYCALEAKDQYKLLGIQDDIYVATMKCFTRFINECYRKTGVYAFDRGWWTVRQISLQLFRIGELEYEMTDWNNDPVISIHIPSDSNMSAEKCVESIKLSKDFFAKYYPKYSECKYICDSWLLSPELKKLLPITSNIIGFQNMFKIVETKPDTMGFVEWVFQRAAYEIATKPDADGKVEMVYQKKDIDFNEMPGHTSLQRNIKEHMLAGGNIGEALGVLK